jgi:hypothetical protein
VQYALSRYRTPHPSLRLAKVASPGLTIPARP